MIVLEKKPKTTKSSDYRTICLIAHTAKENRDDWKENRRCLWRGRVWIEKGKMTTEIQLECSE